MSRITSLTARVLIGLVAGFGGGLIVAQLPALAWVPGLVEPVGALFIAGIRMTVIPLVVSSLIIGVAAAPDARTVGQLGGRALAYFVVLVVAASAVGVALTPVAMALVSIDPASAEALRSGTAAGTGTAADFIERARAVPSLTQWIVELVPVNPVKAASDGAMLPLIVFSLLFGVALSRVDAERRAGLLTIARGVQDATFVLVRWVLSAAPFGVFALAVPLASRLGLSAAGAVLWYIVVVSGLCAAFTALVLYPLATIGGRIPLRDFARAALPAQVVAMSSRSSMAALPAMIEHMGGALKLPPNITGFFLPLSASMFRVGAGIGITGSVCFIAALFGIALSASQLATVAAGTTLLSFSVPGVPAGSIITMVPVLLAAGLPVEGVGILIAVDTIPDMFRTTTNVTGTMAVAAALGGRDAQRVARGDAA